MTVFEKIYEIVRQIPKGSVSTYGRIAFLAGNPRWARVVGYAMASCPDRSIPCHRVVHSDGSLSPSFDMGDDNLQAVYLRNEGVIIKADGKVDLDRCLWP